MILVTVGTQFFDELIQEVDRLAGEGAFGEPVFAQIGQAIRLPRHVRHVRFDHDLVNKAREASLIISHAGTGLLCELIELGRPFVAVANQTKAGNHQLEFLRHLSTLYDFCWIDSPHYLQSALRHARPARPLHTHDPAQLGRNICAYLNSLLRATPSADTRQLRIDGTTHAGIGR